MRKIVLNWENAGFSSSLFYIIYMVASLYSNHEPRIEKKNQKEYTKQRGSTFPRNLLRLSHFIKRYKQIQHFKVFELLINCLNIYLQHFKKRIE